MMAFAQVRLHQDEKTRRSDDRAAKQQPQHGMHFAELAQKQGEHHDSGDDGELRGLKIDRPEMQPAARSVNLRADKFGQNQKDRCRPDTSAARPSGSSDNRSGS